MDDALTGVPSLAGDKTLVVFHRAGLTKIGHLYTKADQDTRIEQAINAMKGEARTPVNDRAWSGLKTRCFTIIARIRSTEAQPAPPHPFCCHITYEIMNDPVVTKSPLVTTRLPLATKMTEFVNEGTFVYHTTHSDFDPRYNRSSFYTFAYPVASVTNRGARVLTYACRHNLFVKRDDTDPGQLPLKYALHAALTGHVPNSCIEVNMGAISSSLRPHAFQKFCRSTKQRQAPPQRHTEYNGRAPSTTQPQRMASTKSAQPRA
eukprot:gene27867-12044_t